jgi:hypothetical protein
MSIKKRKASKKSKTPETYAEKLRRKLTERLTKTIGVKKKR